MKALTRQQIANTVARRSGYHRATAFEQAEVTAIAYSVPCGYRKRSTGAYVPNAYVRKGWSSVYYQVAICVVTLSCDDWQRGLEGELINTMKGEKK